MEWAKALKELYLLGLRDYVKTHYALGPVWNASGKPATALAKGQCRLLAMETWAFAMGHKKFSVILYLLLSIMYIQDVCCLVHKLLHI